MTNSNNITIKTELFKSSIIVSCAILIIFSFLLSGILYYSGISTIHAVIQQRNNAVNFFIGGYFTKIHNAVEFLSNNSKIRNAPLQGKRDRQDILNLYQSLEAADPDINYVYSAYNNGSILINNYTPPEGYNPVTRPWYQAAIKSKPDASGGLPYKEIKSQEWLVSISKVLIDVNHKVCGVVSIDSSIDTVADLLREQVDKLETSYSFVARPSGEIIIHHEKSFLNKTVSDVFNMPVTFDKNAGTFSYKLKNSEKIAYYSHVDRIGWVIVTTVDKKEIVKPIVFQIVISILIVGVIAVILGWILSVSLSKRFVAPLVELKKRINAILTGNPVSTTTYQYPKNEIGLMATDIERLTETGLYDKNIELQAINKKLEFHSTTDQLTELFNRHKMDSELKKEWQRTLRYKHKFSIIMFDIDWFKKVNDTFGHQAGDSVLEEISGLTKKALRSTDIVSRWGGEEFLVLCPETSLTAAQQLATKLCNTVEDYQFTVNTTITISAGVCEFTGQKSIGDLINEADEKLYKAKQQGRNMVVV